MIVDTSAVIAILTGELEHEAFARAIVESPVAGMAAATFLETALVVDGLGDPVKSRRLDELIRALGIEIVDTTAEHARIARAAYHDFGKGSGHPAKLNYGDCFAYALAAATGEPLLFKGDDFVHTDLQPALG
ncbi:MAG: type II toxin-antitoxin system VapC family toxin [Nocardioidaceae bacterium]|nr:type II toxin-antitoxin system VapC family toxin [Nocardioidaceae bacterium]